MTVPDWWLDRPHKLDITPHEAVPTFTDVDLFNEYLKRGYDDVMPFGDYKYTRSQVINIVDA